MLGMGREAATILVVDDERYVRAILKRSLEDAGYQCITAASAAEADVRLAATPIDLVLSDIMMPGESGIELLKRVHQVYPQVAVVMLTAVADAQTAIEAMRLGAYHYLTKPFNLEEVVLVVERALEKRNLALAAQLNHLFLKKKVKEQTEQIRNTFLGAMKSLTEALDAKDPYTRGHSRRVARVASRLAVSMGLSRRHVERIELAGELHDIGKIGISGASLRKNAKLTEQEIVDFQEHPAIGERILKPVVKDKGVLAIVRHHHEFYSGGGYPDGISGAEIPLGARLLSVADAYDAMTSDRPYRRALSPQVALEELMKFSSRQFDPEVVECFIQAEGGIIDVAVAVEAVRVGQW